jgi:hypothetical protein
MMHDREKSDSAIVAVKSANKVGQPTTEPTEPRVEAKGNASQQRTRRAQDRESVSQALERIRKVAKERKRERFTSLFYHLSQETLRTAFFALKREAAPGVDGLTWQDYETDLDRREVTCSPAIRPSFSQRCRVEGATFRTVAAAAMVMTSPSAVPGLRWKQGMLQWFLKCATRLASNRWPRAVVRPCRLRMPAMTASG